jgi:biotin carboxyl carrier protein
MSRHPIESEVTGVVLRVERSRGDHVAEDDPILVVESMKMEIPVCATSSGVILEILVAEGDMVSAGQVVCAVKAE